MVDPHATNTSIPGVKSLSYEEYKKELVALVERGPFSWAVAALVEFSGTESDDAIVHDMKRSAKLDKLSRALYKVFKYAAKYSL